MKTPPTCQIVESCFMPPRMAQTFILLAVALCACTLTFSPRSVRAADPVEPPRAVQRTVLRQLASSHQDRREAATATLAEYKTEHAARLLVDHGLKSQYPDVRHAAYRTLVNDRDSETVCKFLLDRTERTFRKGNVDWSTCGILGALVASELEPVEEKTNELLNRAARQPGLGWELLVSLADEFGAQGDDQSLKSLVKLSEQPLFDVFAARRAIVQAMARSDRPEAIEALISILGRAQGEVRADIGRRLTEISGQSHAVDAARWDSWWKANRDKYSSSSQALRPPPVYGPLYEAAPAHYYGLPIYGQRVAFVLDTSGSMSGLRLAAAQRELLQAIASLPEGVQFNVMTFNQGVFPWSDQLLVASPENKTLAGAFVMSQQALGATWSYDALDAAMQFDVESIYFLTDGEPCGGTVSVPPAIVALLTTANHARRVTINSIGIGVGPPGSVFEIFLQSLAKSNFGEYRRVDQ